MVRPDKMYRKKYPEDFHYFKYGDIEIFIEKPLLYDGSEFLILYVGKFLMDVNGEQIRIIKKQ